MRDFVGPQGAMECLVRKGGLEPPCLSAPPPQDGVSANFTTSAQKTALRRYLLLYLLRPFYSRIRRASYVCKIPALNFGTSGFSETDSSASISASRVFAGSRMASTQRRAAA